MGDEGHDTTKSVTVTVTSSPNPSNSNAAAPNSKAESNIHFAGVQLNVNYFRSIVGILKIVEWIFGIICMACTAPAIFGGAHWFLFVAVFCFIFTFIWACIHFFAIPTVLGLPWLLMELSYTALASVLYFTGFITMFVQSDNTYYAILIFLYRRYDTYIAAACFGLFNFVAYVVECFFHARAFLHQRQPPVVS
jgi:cell division protein FtsX